MNTETHQGWKSITEHEPPCSAALDDARVVTTDRVLVTNNINARDRMGRMSHVWFAAPIQSHRSETGWCAFDAADRCIFHITHWLNPLAPATSTPGTADAMRAELLQLMEQAGLIDVPTKASGFAMKVMKNRHLEADKALLRETITDLCNGRSKLLREHRIGPVTLSEMCWWAVYGNPSSTTQKGGA